jgi:hypothetical protein
LLASFTIGLDAWHCWASGLNDGQSWQPWVDGTEHPIAGDPPLLDHVKPIQRRRLNPVARGAFHCAQQCLKGKKPIATIFCSAHGEGPRAAGLLESIAREEPLSPNAFSLSVHNAVAGLFGIFTAESAPSLSIAAGIEGAGAAFLEAWCRLREQRSGTVLVVLYDDPMPELFRVDDAPPVPLAAGFLLSVDADKAQYRLERRVVPGQPAAHWHQIRNLVNFLQRGERYVTLQSERAQWTWTAL